MTVEHWVETAFLLLLLLGFFIYYGKEGPLLLLAIIGITILNFGVYYIFASGLF